MAIKVAFFPEEQQGPAVSSCPPQSRLSSHGDDRNSTGRVTHSRHVSHFHLWVSDSLHIFLCLASMYQNGTQHSMYVLVIFQNLGMVFQERTWVTRGSGKSI